jgi:hypothetical protein
MKCSAVMGLHRASKIDSRADTLDIRGNEPAGDSLEHVARGGHSACSNQHHEELDDEWNSHWHPRKTPDDRLRPCEQRRGAHREVDHQGKDFEIAHQGIDYQPDAGEG